MKTVNIDGIDYDVLNDSSSITNHEGSITVTHLDKSFTLTLNEIKMYRYGYSVSESLVYKLIYEKARNKKLTYDINESSNFLTKVRKNVIEAVSFANKVIKEDIINEQSKKAKQDLSRFNKESFTISELVEKLQSIKEEHGDLKVTYKYEEEDHCGCCSSDYITVPEINIEHIVFNEDLKSKTLSIGRGRSSISIEV